MRKITLLAVALSAGLAGAALASDIHGAWNASYDRERPGRIYLGYTRNQWNHNGDTINVADLSGITTAQIDSDTSTPVQFQLVRESGTITFEGSFKRGDGAGQYSFQPNRAFIDTLRGLGVDFVLRRHGDKDDDDTLFQLTMQDVSSSFIRAMQSLGYRETLTTYHEMRIFGVNPQFIQDLKEAGYENVPAKKLIRLRIAGVDMNFIRNMNKIE
jgi:opacity protein-like surface antigen